MEKYGQHSNGWTIDTILKGLSLTGKKPQLRFAA